MKGCLGTGTGGWGGPAIPAAVVGEGGGGLCEVGGGREGLWEVGGGREGLCEVGGGREGLWEGLIVGGLTVPAGLDGYTGTVGCTGMAVSGFAGGGWVEVEGLLVLGTRTGGATSILVLVGSEWE